MCRLLDYDSFDFVQVDLVSASVVEAGRPGALVVCHLLCNFEPPPFFRYSVMPVARKLWQPTLVPMPAAKALRPIIR